MWTASPGDGPDEELFRRMSAPENEIPGAVAHTVLLARTDDVAVALLGLRAYSTGVSFDLALRVRPGAVSRLGLRATWPYHRFWHDGLLVGVELADGRRLRTLAEQWPPAAGDDAVLTQAGGGGGDTAYDQTVWLTPLPPEGPLRLVVRCAEIGIEDSAVELDGGAIRRAAEQAVELWPWAPPPDDEPGPPPPPEVPPDSWFAC